MKKLFFLFLGLLILMSCSSSGDKQNDKGSISTTESSTDSAEVIVDQNLELETDSKSFTVRAKFIDFALGDASHYGFEDDSGKYWDFAGCESKTFDFAEELNENEIDERNQGWGSNKELQGEWFLLTIIKVEQPEYSDGPIVMANIIQEAVLIEE